MKVVHIVKYGRFPQLREVPIPALQQDQILVKMKYAPINPSDIFFYMGKYGIQKKGFPVVGFEGSGVVEKARDSTLIGKKVSVMANSSNGTHASHIISNKNDLLVWPDSADLQQISMAFINPVSCVGLCSLVQLHKPQNVIISAAASQIGRMLVANLRNKHPNLNIYGLNRSENKKQILTSLGLTDLIMIQDPPAQKLKNIQGKTVFLDCVGGAFAGKTFNTLGQNSLMVCYGRQSGQDLNGVDLGGLYYKNKVIRGFWLNNWLKEVNEVQLQEAKQQVKNNFTKYYSSVIRKTFPIGEFMDAYRLSIKDKSEGKVLLQL